MFATGADVGVSVGVPVGTSVGETVGAGVGSGVGLPDGTCDGSSEGLGDGAGDGAGDGFSDGDGDGAGDGFSDGDGDGAGEGSADGSGDGARDGSGDGAADGCSTKQHASSQLAASDGAPVQTSTQLVGRVLPSVGHSGRHPSKKLPSPGQSTAQSSGSDGAMEPSNSQYSFGQHASRQPRGIVLEPESQTRTQKPVAGAPTGQAFRHPKGFSSESSSGQISTHVSSSIGPTLPSGHVVAI